MTPWDISRQEVVSAVLRLASFLAMVYWEPALADGGTLALPGGGDRKRLQGGEETPWLYRSARSLECWGLF